MALRDEYIRLSFEINIFFQRIMKEHLFFIETNLQPVATALKNEAIALKQSFETILSQTVYYSKGMISENTIQSNQLVTPFTLQAEEVTAMLTGVSINTKITKSELEITGESNQTQYNDDLYNTVFFINTKSLDLLRKVVNFQKSLLDMTSNCTIFTTLYPEMLVHVTHEAEYYQELLTILCSDMIPEENLCKELDFWNHIMEEHANFIDGMLDPTETDLKKAAEIFAGTYEILVGKCITNAENQIKQDSMDVTEGIKDYKETATEGLLKCEIKSIIPPLLADHVLREANHYLALLNKK